MANRAYKYRIYPSREQASLLAKTFGCVRFVYNKCLEEQERLYANGEKYASRTAMNNYCNHVLKDEFPFLREVDKFALTNTIYHLDDGYRRMFRHQGRHPRFKSRRKSKASYTTNWTNGNIKVLEHHIQLPKLGKVKAVIHRSVPDGYILKSATVSLGRDGTYYVSVLYTYEEDVPLNTGHKAVGLDYKSNGLYVSSDGENCDMPHYYRESQAALAKAQRKLRHKEKGSRNWEKQQRRIAKIYRRTANQRKDFLHKKSTEIANRYDIVCVEDLNMCSMANKGFGNGKATLDNGNGMFQNMLEYKLHDRGKAFVKIGKWYPSSQLCCHCGSRQKLELHERVYRCPVCGAVTDRDFNAAFNILIEGMRIIA